jgi:hypothetical protein
MPYRTYHALALLYIHLVAEHGLNQELVSPAVEGVETLGVVYIVDEHTAVGTTVESNTERLESLLTSGIPELSCVSDVLR